MTWNEFVAQVEADGVTGETLLEKVEWHGVGTEVQVTTKANALGEVTIQARAWEPRAEEEGMAEEPLPEPRALL